MHNIPHFTGSAGNQATLDKLNQLVDCCNALMRVQGFGGILVEFNPGKGFTINSPQKVSSRVPSGAGVMPLGERQFMYYGNITTKQTGFDYPRGNGMTT